MTAAKKKPPVKKSKRIPVAKKKRAPSSNHTTFTLPDDWSLDIKLTIISKHGVKRDFQIPVQGGEVQVDATGLFKSPQTAQEFTDRFSRVVDGLTMEKISNGLTKA